MYAKRKLVELLRYNPKQFVSLERLERPSRVQAERICEYSKSSAVEIIDPRNGSLKGHYFQERFTFLIRNVIIEPMQGLIYSEEGALIMESTTWPLPHAYSSFPWNPGNNLKRLHIKAGILLTSNAFWHWLIEDLASTIFALQIDSNSPILVADNPPKYVLDFLATVDREVIFLKGPVQVDSLILVGKGKDSGWPHPIDLDILSEFKPFTQANQANSPPKRVYVSRRASKRSPENEEEIERMFSARNFEILRLEDLNLLDKIELLSNVSFLAGVHGAGLGNLIWLKKDSNVLDIANENYWTESIHRAAFLKDVNYNFLVYEGSFDNSISIEELENALNGME